MELKGSGKEHWASQIGQEAGLGFPVACQLDFGRRGFFLAPGAGVYLATLAEAEGLTSRGWGWSELSTQGY